VRDVSGCCPATGGRPPEPGQPLRVVYQDACHLNHAQGIREATARTAAGGPGLELIEIEEADLCCGSAGIYNLTQPRAAAELGERKARAILEAHPDVIATGNPGCALQLAASLRRLGRGDLPIVHPVQLLR
jgi:glycolate oxidase iron-sulfur subunit